MDAIAFQFHSRGFCNSPQQLCKSRYAGGELSIVFDATHSSRVAQKTQIDQKGAYEIFGLPISFRIQAGRNKAQTVSNLVITILHFL
jgi:hypothetical protein